MMQATQAMHHHDILLSGVLGHIAPIEPEIPMEGVFYLIQGLSGVIGYEAEPATDPRSTVLGPIADQYFWAHGYLPGTVSLIQWAYKRSHGQDDFVAELNQEGIPVTEAIYMFVLISQGREI
jgi:hypothetical protein